MNRLHATVISYLAARPSRDLIIAGHQQITRDWWKHVLPLCDPFISPIVLEEVERGDIDAAQLRREMIAGLPVLEIVPEVGRLAESYHPALAAWHGMEYLLSWNCTHIVSGRVRRQIEEINAEHGIRTPVMCTPEELMEV
ncbi:MAG: type II toxin-antitoxin system VapC family toxin [Chloroflexi bacterium]|nr:type II toxin-antitoxin system VapC family toxin [Chloroflexota bacterium]